MNATTRKMFALLLAWQTANEAGDSDEASRLLQQTIGLDDGTDSDARTKSGLVVRLRAYLLYADELRPHDPQAALSVLERAAARWPADVHVHLLLGRIRLSEGDGAAALTALQRSFEIEPRAATCLFIASAFDILKRSPEGVAWLHRALEIDPDNEEAHYNLGALRSHKGDLEGAVASLRRAIEIDPNYALAHAKLANVLSSRAGRPAGFDDPNWVAAVEHYKRAVELDPNDGWSHAHLTAMDETDNVADTKTHHRAAMRLLPEVSVVWSNYADFAWRRELEPSDEVDRLYRYAITLDQSDGTARYAFGQHLWRTNRQDQARTELEEADRLGHPKALAWIAEQEAARIET